MALRTGGVRAGRARREQRRGGATSRSRVSRRRVHAESFLRIPWVEHALGNPAFALRARACDARWYYAKVVGEARTGFNPFGNEVYYAARSRFADWRPHAAGSSRLWNRDDSLVAELLFVVHDYIHGWGAALIRRLAPQLELGYGRLTPSNFEDLAFAYLVTEAIATVALDYWYLATLDLWTVVPNGTHLQDLAVAYSERRLDEYRRFRPDLVVQRPGFFAELARFYCMGELAGFDAADLDRSPALARWLRNEVRYGHTQRTGARSWLSYLSGIPQPTAAQGLPFDCEQRWRRELLRNIGEVLWAFVRRGEEPKIVPLDASRVWRSPLSSPVDPRYININSMSEKELLFFHRYPGDIAIFDVFLEQYISRFDYSSFDRDKLSLLPHIRAERDVRALIAVFGREPRVPIAKVEPRDLNVVVS